MQKHQKKEKALEMGVAAVKTAKKFTDNIEFYCEDSGRADKNYLFRVIEAVIAAGATTVNIPDTTGYAVPQQYGALIAEIIEKVPNSDKAIFSVHCHDDLGMSVANSLAGVANGARQIEGYRALNNISVTVKDVSAAGSLIDIAVGAGANRVASLSFQVSDPGPARLQALRDAVAMATIGPSSTAMVGNGPVTFTMSPRCL